MNPTLPVNDYYADDDDDNVGDNSTGRVEAASSSSIIRNRSLGNNIGSTTNDNVDQFTSPAPTQHQQAPKSGHIPPPTNGVRSLSDDWVSHRTLASPLLRHRHHPNRRQTSSGSMTPNSRIHHRRLQQQQYNQQQQQQQWNPQIQGSHSLDDADIAAGAAQLRAMELLSSPPQSLHHPSSGSNASNNTWRSSPSSRSLGSQTPTNFFARKSKYYSGGEIELTGPLVAQRMEREGGGGGGDHHYLYGGSEHDFLALSPDGEENDDDLDYEDRQYLLQQQQLLSNHTQYPPYGLQSIEDSPDIVAINNRRQKMQFTLSSSSADDDNRDAEYFTALLPSKPPLYSSSDDGTATSQSNATATTTTTTHSNTTTHLTAKFAVLGWDLTTYTRRTQFLISAGGTFVFSLIYGYLQELISVTLCNRKLGLFLALAQFTGYTILSYFFRRLDMSGGGGGSTAISGGGSGPIASVGGGGTTFFSRKFRRLNNWGKLRGGGGPSASSSDPTTSLKKSIPIELYIGLSVLRAIDLGMTNLAMQYVNYPAKTIMKSTR
jgi:hypothetical protein